MICDFPHELLQYICTFAYVHSLFNLRRTCKKFHDNEEFMSSLNGIKNPHKYFKSGFSVVTSTYLKHPSLQRSLSKHLLSLYLNVIKSEPIFHTSFFAFIDDFTALHKTQSTSFTINVVDMMVIINTYNNEKRMTMNTLFETYRSHKKLSMMKTLGPKITQPEISTMIEQHYNFQIKQLQEQRILLTRQRIRLFHEVIDPK